MAIREIFEDDIEQACEVCGAVRRVPDTDVVVGVERDGQFDAKVVQLPNCSSCGAREFLIRSADDEPEHPSPGSFGHRHRLMVDALHSKLVKEGRVADGIDPQKAQGRERSSEELDRWFKGRLRAQRMKEQDGGIKPEPEPTKPSQ
jgi:hypothetical protein